MQTLTWMLVGTTNHCMFSHQSEVNKCFEILTQEGGNSSTKYVSGSCGNCLNHGWADSGQNEVWVVTVTIPFFLSFHSFRADPTKRVDMHNPKEMAQHFKETFSRSDVRVHFRGVWFVFPRSFTFLYCDVWHVRDTMSSVGISWSRALPQVYEHRHICFFHHALALDECCVKFLPEYIHGGKSVIQKGIFNWSKNGLSCGVLPDYLRKTLPQAKLWWGDGASVTFEIDRELASNVEQDHPTSEEETVQPCMKEVWFAGSHSDVYVLEPHGWIYSNPSFSCYLAAVA